MARVHVTVKSVEAANAKMQLSRAHGGGDRVLAAGFHSVKTPVPSRVAIAQAGQRALQSFKK